MSVRTTDSVNVALFDSTNLTAFGPVFACVEDAEDFLQWLKRGEEEERTIQIEHDLVMFKADPRIYRHFELNYLYDAWKSERRIIEITGPDDIVV
jgi:hypothetical protein